MFKSQFSIHASCYPGELDAQLMCRVRDGDWQSFTLLLERHRKPVINFLKKMVGRLYVAEDLSQEVFLRVYRSRARYEPTAKFTTWLYRIATHVAINWLRDGHYESKSETLSDRYGEGPPRQFADCKPTAEQSLLALAKAQEIRNAVSRLPENQRAAVIMHKYNELEYGQIAGILGCSESAVKSLLFRAYERLRTLLAHFDV